MIAAVKSLFKDSVVYGIANVIQKLTPIVVIPLIINHLGDNALKLYDLSFIYVYLFSSLIVLGMDTAASAFYFDRHQEKLNQREVLAYAFLVQVISLIGYLLLLYPLRYKIAGVLFPNNPDMVRFWVIALGIIPGYILFNYGLSILLWKRKKIVYVALCVLQTVLNIGGVYTVVVLMDGTTAQMFYVLIASMSICGLAAFALVARHMVQGPWPINLPLIRKLLLFGIPFALTSFFRQVIPSVDRYFLLAFHQDRYLPQYILAVKLASFINIAFAAFMLAFTPYSLNKINQADAEAEISGIFRVVSIAVLTFIPTLLLFKDWLIEFFADSSYDLSAQLLPLFLFGWAFDLFTNFTLLGVYRSKKSFFILGLLVTGTIIIALLDLLLVPLYGIYGAAFSFFLTKTITFFIAFFVLRRHFKIDINMYQFLGLFFVAAFCSYLFFMVSTLIYIFLLIALISIASCYAYRVLQQYHLKNIFSVHKQ